MEKSPSFQDNVESYSLRYSIGSTSTIIAEHIPASDSSIEFESDFVIGEQYPFTLSLTSKAGSDGQQNQVSYRKDAAFGTSVQELTSILYFPAQDRYYLLSDTGYAPDPDGVYKLDQNFAPVDTLRFGLTRFVSVNKLLKTPNDDRLFLIHGTSITEIEMSSMLNTKSKYLGEFYVWTNEETYSISNNAYFLYFQWKSGNNLKVYDFDGEKNPV